MVDKLEPLDWEGVVAPASKNGQLMAFLELLPCARWVERAPNRATLLHYACRGDNVAAAAALLKHGLDVNARNNPQWCPAHSAANRGQPGVLELLCTFGADMHARSGMGNTPLEHALSNLRAGNRGAAECARLLVANGVRLALLHSRDLVPPELEAFERGVLRCRSMVITLLALKRRRGRTLQVVDRWMVREIGFALWATRTDVKWQPELD